MSVPETQSPLQDHTSHAAAKAPPSSPWRPVTWILTQGTIGMENQCLGLAEALGVDPVVKRVRLRAPWRQLSPFLRLGLSYAYDGSADLPAPPWPDLMIVSGRASVPAALRARREAGTFTVYIQNPVIDPSFFSLVALPRHDGVIGDHVIATRGSLHRVTPGRLSVEAARFAPQYADLPRPYISVSIGGSNAVYQLTPKEMKPIAEKLAAFARKTGGALLVTTSRRTGAENLALLQAELAHVPAMIWDGTGPNPYYGMLGLADIIVVTGDSVNMVSEAASTGKPVYVIGLSGGSDKFRRFHQTLRDDGITRPFTGDVVDWTYHPLNDVQLVADRVREMMGQGRVTSGSAETL